MRRSDAHHWLLVLLLSTLAAKPGHAASLCVCRVDSTVDRMPPPVNALRAVPLPVDSIP